MTDATVIRLHDFLAKAFPGCRTNHTKAALKLQDVITRLQREEIDVDIEVQFKRRKYAGKRLSARQRFRLVGLRNDDTGGYQLYVTNLPTDRFNAKDVAAIYRARWTIEMLFKSLKSDSALDQLPSRNKHAVLALVYAAILTWVASRELLVAVRELLAEDGLRVTQGRWTRLLRTWAATLLLVVTSPPRHVGELARAVEFALLVVAPDPHRTRMSLGEEVEHGIPFSRRAAPVSGGV